MSEQSPALPELLGGLHDMLANELGVARRIVSHSGTMGDVSESRWLGMLSKYLPLRYQANKAFVIDSKGESSDQIDVVIHDSQYSPFVLNYENAIYVPAESVYAIFEVKQNLNAGHVDYAAKKIASVRKLYRTSIPVPHAGGEFPAKPLHRILGGILCLESDWSPPFGKPLLAALDRLSEDEQLDIGCSAENGLFEVTYQDGVSVNVNRYTSESTLALFALRLIHRLQCIATVPCMDVMAYAKPIIIHNDDLIPDRFTT